ncbi:MAG TPA: membrane protein insertase YidC [Pseudolysinimonas sp.]|nr:membrane protein insertase YidC [Pseudolysinimonas sp.]
MNIFDLPVLSALLSATSDGFAALGAVVTPVGAIVLVTLVVRALLIPVGVSVARADRARRRLAPRLAELQRRWKSNPERLQRETLALYAAEKVSPFAGILPVLLQAPVLTLVYATFTVHEVPGALFGTALAAHLTTAASPGVFLVVLAAMAVVAWLARRAALRQSAAAATTGGRSGAGAPNLVRILSWAPFISVIAGAFLPLAATLYLAISSAWSLAERAVLRRVLAPA